MVKKFNLLLLQALEFQRAIKETNPIISIEQSKLMLLGHLSRMFIQGQLRISLKIVYKKTII